MKKFFLLVLVTLAALSCRGPRVIKDDEMEEIMYQMLLQDQYLKQHPELRRVADTTLVYGGIFESFGYDTADYLYSLEYYLEESARMEKIMGRVSDRLEKDSELVRAEIRQENWRNDFLRIWKMNPDTIHQPKPPRPLDSLQVQFSKDSLFYIPKGR